MSDWKQSDIRKLFDASLDGFAFEFFDAPSFRSLGSKEKIKILRAMKADASSRFAYEWMMRAGK